jgi:hypothetical protein
MFRVFDAVEYFFIGLTFPAGKNFSIREPEPARNRPFPVNLIPELNAHECCLPAFVPIKYDSSAT